MERESRLYAFGPNRHNDGVAGIIPTRESCADVDIGRQYVHEFSLALVTPLRSEDGGHCTYDQSSLFNYVIPEVRARHCMR